MEAKLTLTLTDDFDSKEYSLPVSVYIPLILKEKIVTYFKMCAEELRDQIADDVRRHRNVYGSAEDTLEINMNDIIDLDDEPTTRIMMPVVR